MRSKKLKQIKPNNICLTLSDKQYKWLVDISKYYNVNIQQMIRIILETEILRDGRVSENEHS